MPIQVRGVTAFVADGTNNNWFGQFSANLPFGALFPATKGSTQYTMGTAFAQYNCPSLFTSQVHTYRVVCGGLRFTVTSSVPNSQGSLIFSEQDASPVLSAVRSVGVLDDVNASVFPVATGFQYTYLFKPVGPRNFVVASTSTTTGLINTMPTFNTLNVELQGGVGGQTTVTVEYIFHVEFTTVENSGLGVLTPPDPVPNLGLVQAATRTAAKMPVVVQGSADEFNKKLMEAAKGAAATLAYKAGDMALEGAMAFLGI